MTIDPIHRPSLARNEAGVLSRLNELERLTRTPVVTVDAGGAAWTSGNTAWIDPTTVLEWTELRVSNTTAGSQVWRCLKNSGGTKVWTVIG